MANTYFLNGTTAEIRFSLNGGDFVTLQPLDLTNPDLDMTAVMGLSAFVSADTLGHGTNTIDILVEGESASRLFDVRVDSSVPTSRDVQIVLFGNEVECRAEDSTDGFTVTEQAGGSDRAVPTVTAATPRRTAKRRRMPRVRTSISADALTYELIADDDQGAVYRASNDDTAGDGVAWSWYYLYANGTPPGTLTFDDSYDSRGCYVFTDEELGGEALLAELNDVLTQDSTNYSRIAWRYASDDYAIVQGSSALAVVGTTTIDIGNWQYRLRDGAPIAQDTSTPGLRIDGTAGQQVDRIQVRVNEQPAGEQPPALIIPLDGDHRGSIVCPWTWDLYALQTTFGGLPRLFYGADAATATRVQYPLFTPAPDPGRIPANDMPFDLYMQPMSPLNGDRTRFALAPDEPNALASNYLASTTNAAVTVAPDAVDDGLMAGFGFGAGPSDDTNGDRYFCPVGRYAVSAVDAPATNDRIQVRGGVSSTEYVLVEPGDVLDFQNDQPAFADGYDPTGTSDGTLTKTLTTSWVRVRRAASDEDADGDGAGPTVDTSYCAQSSASTYFGNAVGGATYAYPIAVGASLLKFEEDRSEVLFPMMAYGGVYYRDTSEGIDDPNPTITPAALDAIERQVIGPARREQLEPFFDTTYGPVFFDTSTNLALNGGFARTPLGLLVQLNDDSGSAPAGTIQQLLIARSPQADTGAPADARLLTFGADGNGVVNPTFSNTALDENLFMVVTDASAVAPFEPVDGGYAGSNQIKLGDFTFRMTLGAAKTMALFKFVPGVTTRALIGDTSAWSPLVGSADVDTIRARLEAFVAVADEGGELFANFVRIIDDPNWNGVLFVDCDLPLGALPLDIQILLGGIEGDLRAHHFGVTINRIDEAAAALDRSSLFAVINHDEGQVRAPKGYPYFQVPILKVAYANSALVTFESQIGFSIDTLFGNPVSLLDLPDGAPEDDPENGTIVIDGTYTLFDDGTGSLVFTTSAERVFAAITSDGALRIVEAQTVAEATLVPIRQEVDGDTTTAFSQFVIDSVLALADGVGGDLFSYGALDGDGVPTEGLAIADYAWSMTTTITDDEATLDDAIPTDLTALKVDQVLSRARAGSFEETFPSTIEGVDVDEAGLRPTQTGEWAVKVGSETFDASANYSLEFAVPLGMLGALLSARSDVTAQMFIGWTPGGSAGAADGVGLMLRLPADVSGPDGFLFQGFISGAFESVQLDRATVGNDQVYYLRFLLFQGSLLNFLLTYSTDPKDLGLFGGPSDPGGSNAMMYLGKSTETWNGPSLSVTLDGVPGVFIGRSFDIVTDPTNPNVISDVWKDLDPLTTDTVETFLKSVYANSGLYNSDAGLTFGLNFSFKSLTMTVILHDSSFYGAQIKVKPEKKDEGGDGGDGGDGSGGGEARALTTGSPGPAFRQALREAASALVGTAALAESSGGDSDDSGFLSKIANFEFTIIYRKISDGLGVWSADIFLDLGTLTVGIFSLTLPNFSISIWTNGDWRFAIGWPFTGDSAHPIVVQFQAGPFPIIAKAGFYLGKLSSAAAPDQFGDEFQVIWTFGLGFSAGLGKEYKSGPFSAKASVMAGITLEGFLASYTGELTEDGVDYWWWGISLFVTGELSGKVDFKVIVVDVSLTITITVAFAIETAHKTPLTLTVDVKAKASVKVLFVKVSFSFSLSLELFSFTFGSGPVAKMSGPTPTAGDDALRVTQDFSVDAARAARKRQAALLRARPILPQAHRRRAERLRRGGPLPYVRRGDRSASTLATTAAVDSGPTTIDVGYVLQTTTVSTDGTTWTPQGVATLVMRSDAADSPFAKLADGLAAWLIDTYGGDEESFQDQLTRTEEELQDGAFDADAVDSCLSSTFVFAIADAGLADETDVVMLAMPTTLVVTYDGGSTTIGADTVPGNYEAIIEAAFACGELPTPTANGDDSVAGIVFVEYFGLLAQQLVQLLIDTGASDLAEALAEISLSDLGGFASRFLMGGLRLPDPAAPEDMRALYLLTAQQFALAKDDDGYVLTVGLEASDATPAWITVADDTTSALDDSAVHDSGPASLAYTPQQAPALATADQYTALNNTITWSTGGGDVRIADYGDDLVQAIKTAAAAGDDRYLSTVVVGGDGEAQATLSGGEAGWTCTTALSLTIQLAGVPDPSGDPGAILPDVFSLLGADEAGRAQLQALLESGDDVIAVDLLWSPSRGEFQSTEVPTVLVRTDLSTDAGGAGAAIAAANADDGDDCANYAKLPDGELRAFLRLVWEVSVVHSTGFYIQVQDLDLEQFDEGPATFTLLIRTGTAGTTVKLATYQNAVVGDAPDDDQAVYGRLESDPAGTAVPAYAGAYPGGNAAWQILWEDAPADADATDGDFVQSLYQLVSTKVTGVNGGAPAGTTCWSRPVTSEDVSPDGAATTTWSYARSFATADLVGSDNRYAATGDTFEVTFEALDVFGNPFPASLQTSADLTVLYNDLLLGLADWGGTQAYFMVGAFDDGPLVLRLLLTLDAGVVVDGDGTVDADQLPIVLETYQTLRDQLGDANTSATVDTGGVLAASAFSGNDDGTLPVLLTAWVDAVLTWLGQVEAAPDTPVPDPMTIDFGLSRSYPTDWDGDLQELVVELVLVRRPIDDTIAAKLPGVYDVRSPLQARQDASTQTDPSGLTSFATDLETAYYPFDDDQGVIKVATGTNSDLTSARFGQSSIWLMRWSDSDGVAVDILNDDDNPPVFYAPIPLSTQLITRNVDGLLDYSSSLTDPTEVSRVFSGVDMDLWARSFLTTLESFFLPTMAPTVALNSSDGDGPYDAFVDDKTDLAGAISDQVEFVYDYGDDVPPSDPTSARETWRQALLRTLENDYGLSTLVQLQALVSLNGTIEPGATTPPRLFGSVAVPGTSSNDTLPYTLSPAKLALEAGTQWLNTLVGARDPEAQRAFDLDLAYQVTQVEHAIDDGASACGYTPSSWLTFVIQDDTELGRAANTLNQPIGDTRIPVPLRTYPPLPKLIAATATQDTAADAVTAIDQALTWTFATTVQRSSAAQDTLVLTVTFNEPAATDDSGDDGALLRTTGRPLPSDLFDALARFVFEYPALEPYIDTLVDGSADSLAALDDFVAIAAGVAATWPSWEQPAVDTAPADDAGTVSWTYRIDDDEDSSDLIVVRVVEDGQTAPPFPVIDGYGTPSVSGDTATYPRSGDPAQTLVLSWASLYVLDFQSARTAARTDRNSNLAPDGLSTNPQFVYSTETVRAPAVSIPLITASTTLELSTSATLDAGILDLLEQLSAVPDGSVTTGVNDEIRFQSPIAYRYQVFTTGNDAGVFSLLPVFLVEDSTTDGNEGVLATGIQQNLACWRAQTGAQSPSASLSFQVTLYATQIVDDTVQLPLVQFQGLALPVTDTDAWWGDCPDGDSDDDGIADDVRLTAIRSIGAAARSRLAADGITTTGGLLARARTAADRRALARALGVPTRRVLTWANLADLLRVPGVTPADAAALEAAGVDTVRELRRRNAANLHQRLARTRGRTRDADTVAAWVAAAGALDPALEY